MSKSIDHVYVTCAASRGIAKLEYDSGLECGAVLLGAVEEHRGRIVVHEVNAVPLGTRRSVEINLGDFAYREDLAKLLIVGDLHSHTTYQGERATASAADLESWRREAAGLRQPIAGLIVHPRGERWDRLGSFVDWSFPLLSAWITALDGAVRDAKISNEEPWLNELALKAGMRSIWGWSG